MFLGPYLARTLTETNNLTYLFHKTIQLYRHIQIVLLA